MSDSYFLGTVARVHKAKRFSSVTALEGALRAVESTSPENHELKGYLKGLAEEETAEFESDLEHGDGGVGSYWVR